MKETVKAAQQSAKVITAVNKLEKVLKTIPDTLEDLKGLQTEANIIKEDLTLGLSTFEADIEAKKEAIETKLKEAKISTSEQIEKLTQDVKDKQASIKKEIEELNYSHKKAIEREDLDTASLIAGKYDSKVITIGYLEVQDEKLESIKLELAEVHDKELKEKSRGYAIAENKLKSEHSKENAILTTQLEGANSRVVDLENQVLYLKEQLTAERQAGVERLAAAKSDVSVNNDNTGRK